MLDEPPSADASRSDDDVHDALRDACLERDRSEPDGGQRRQFRGFQHHCVPSRQRGRELPRGDHEREVPRHDQPDHPERLANRERLAAGDRDRVSEQPLGRAGVVAEGVDHHLHLAPSVGDRLARVAGFEHCQLLAPVCERVGECVEQPAPVTGLDGTPGREGLACALDIF